MSSNTEQPCVSPPTSPSFVIDLRVVRKNALAAKGIPLAGDVKWLYAVKSLAAIPVLEVLGNTMDGFSVSSQFEARMAADVAGVGQDVEFVSPGLRDEDLGSLLQCCTSITLNSAGHVERFAKTIADAGVRVGVRINPDISVVQDKRYDACRPESKLGIRMEELKRAWEAGFLARCTGLHFHTACLSHDWYPLLKTLRAVEQSLEAEFYKVDWINLGGGYLWDEASDFGPLQEAINLLTTKYGIEVFLEPGAGFVNSAGYLIASVIDIFTRDGKSIAVLDTTVNHLPEVFEYQYEPDVMEHVIDAPHEYILAGCSCLAGDLFGEYSFEEPLEIGSRVTFANVGAYSLVKAHMFNGINLPSIYLLTEAGDLELVRRFTYDDFLSRCGAPPVAAI